MHADKREENEQRAFRRVVQALQESDWIRITNDQVWIIREDRFARATARPGPSDASKGNGQAAAA
jgi:hypothetical protein